MKLLLLTIGKPKLPGLSVLCEEYFSRLQHYTKAEWLTCKNENEILVKIDAIDYVVICDERGKQFSSVELSKWLQTQQEQAVKRVVFVIGAADGHSEEMRKRANLLFSFSKMTLQHEMAFALLLEQLYRGFTILKGEPYHRV